MPSKLRPAGEPRWTRRALLRTAPVLLVGLFAGLGCGQSEPKSEAKLQQAPSGDLLETPALGQMPSFATMKGPRVVDAYRYAAGNRDVLRYMPCYCGCGSGGHESNYDCYVYAIASDGRVTYSNHGAG